MKLHHTLLAVLVAVIWGFAFVATKVGLDSFSAPQLTALRFLIASIPVFFLPRPAISWPVLIMIGLTLFAGQFLLQFFGIVAGMPPGLASVVVQSQAFFTILIASMFLAEHPLARQLIGMAVAGGGLFLIGLTTGRSLTVSGFVLTLASAVSWSIGNVMMKRLSEIDMFHLVGWLSLVPPLPALILSLMLDDFELFSDAIMHVSWLGLGAVLYLGLVATALAYAIWGRLLCLYPAAHVTPYALLAPCVGTLASALAFKEQFEPLRLIGMAMMLLGLVIATLPAARIFRRWL